MFSVRNPWARAGIKRSSQERKIASPRMTSEEQARKHIDALLLAAGWHICDVADANIHAALGVAIREFPLDSGFGFADYLLHEAEIERELGLGELIWQLLPGKKACRVRLFRPFDDGTDNWEEGYVRLIATWQKLKRVFAWDRE